MSRNLDLTELIKLTAAGLDVASFVEIRSSLTDRYRSIFGSDIDLSTGSADGIFVNDTALLINNILQTIKTLYNNLDVNTASGVYLDSLCRLSNVKRKSATKSIAELSITNDSEEAATLYANEEFVDQAGTVWRYSGQNDLVINARAEQSIQVVCSEYGDVKAPAGWITSTVRLTSFEVTQSEDAIIGSEQESDADLRARRNRSLGPDGITVLESLIGALLEVDGIEDVYIFNNNSAGEQTADDGTNCSPHSIYVVVRQKQDVQIEPRVIGSLIYEKLTPGIHTTETSDQNAESMEYEYTPSLIGSTALSYDQTIYWKRAIPIHPNITVKIIPQSYFDPSEVLNIFAAIKDYANNLPIGQSIDLNEILLNVIDADPTFKGRRTYNIMFDDISIDTSVNNLTYYNYTDYSVSPEQNDDTYVTDTSGKITITIS